MTEARLGTVGREVEKVAVSIGPRFLELFSGQLYSSPNKAFEELVSNSWDAGAGIVYIGIADDLSEPDAAVWVLDDGVSMDIEGFRLLWAVASSIKGDQDPISRRPQIGKFGVGKLATYVLAHQLTYFCKARDGVIRTISMDYREIEDAEPDALNVAPLELVVRELTEEDLRTILDSLAGGDHIQELISSGVPRPDVDVPPDDFGHPDTSSPVANGTWTLALLSDLKDAGRRMQHGHIRRMLRAALPLGGTMTIDLAGETLTPTKAEVDVSEEWKLGPGLGLDSVLTVDDTRHNVTELDEPYPHLRIEVLEDAVSGTVRLHTDRISGGKSEERGFSNGFFINVKGRVINLDDPYFGLENLSHSAWAKFRATIRADGLGALLRVDREGLIDGPQLRIFRSFLMALFNLARSTHDATVRASWPAAGEILTDRWGVVPLEPLREVVEEALESPSTAPSFIDLTDVEDREAFREQWADYASEDAGAFISEVDFEDRSPEDSLVRYDVASRRVLVNRSHPFAREHGSSHEEQVALRDTALVEFLTDTYMVRLGLADDQISEIREYRDQTARLIARVRRKTGVQIAALLMDVTAEPKPFEAAVGDALEYLGLDVERMGGSGDPEGLAKAPLPPDEDDATQAYSFTYDAKSSGKGKAKTKDVNPGRLARHRDANQAQHVLVVAPDFEEGALTEECIKSDVTPVRAGDIARLLLSTASAGPISLVDLRKVFDYHDPAEVSEWVAQQIEQAQSARRITFDLVFESLERVGTKGPDVLTTSVLAHEMRQIEGDESYPTEKDVSRLFYGLEVLVPSLIRVAGQKVVLGAAPRKIQELLMAQVEALPEDLRFGLAEVIVEDNPE